MAGQAGFDGTSRDLVFVSYSHEDAGWAQRFKVLLKPLVRVRGLSIWDDTAIRAGDHWYEEIELMVARSAVALLLVSADFLASDFVIDDELPMLLRHEVRLAPALIGDCPWGSVPELANVQWLRDPVRDDALKLVPAEPTGLRDRWIRRACERIFEIAPDDGSLSETKPGQHEPTFARKKEAPTGAALGKSSGVPDLPLAYVYAMNSMP